MSACLTFYNINHYKTNNTIIFEDHTKSGYIIIKNDIIIDNGAIFWLSLNNIRDNYIFEFSITSENYDNIKSIEINENSN